CCSEVYPGDPDIGGRAPRRLRARARPVPPQPPAWPPGGGRELRGGVRGTRYRRPDARGAPALASGPRAGKGRSRDRGDDAGVDPRRGARRAADRRQLVPSGRVRPPGQTRRLSRRLVIRSGGCPAWPSVASFPGVSWREEAEDVDVAVYGAIAATPTP